VLLQPQLHQQTSTAPADCCNLHLTSCHPALAMPPALCLLILCVCAACYTAVQYGQSHFFKLPGGKLKPDEDGESCCCCQRHYGSEFKATCSPASLIVHLCLALGLHADEGRSAPSA
jgi:hypothetical protein